MRRWLLFAVVAGLVVVGFWALTVGDRDWAFPVMFGGGALGLVLLVPLIKRRPWIIAVIALAGLGLGWAAARFYFEPRAQHEPRFATVVEMAAELRQAGIDCRPTVSPGQIGFTGNDRGACHVDDVALTLSTYDNDGEVLADATARGEHENVLVGPGWLADSYSYALLQRVEDAIGGHLVQRRFSSIRQLASALKSGGAGCHDLLSPVPGLSTRGSRDGVCRVAGDLVSLNVYACKELRPRPIDKTRGGRVSWVMGPNWMVVTGKDEAADRIHDAIGGEVFSPDEGPRFEQPGGYDAFTDPYPCRSASDPPRASFDLVLPRAVKPGKRVMANIINTGNVVLLFGWGFTLERKVEGSWSPVRVLRGCAVTLEARPMQPGDVQVESINRCNRRGDFDIRKPGLYRVTKEMHVEDDMPLDEVLTGRAVFRVTPR